MTRIPNRFLVLSTVFLLTVALFGCDGGPSSSSPPGGDAAVDFNGSFDGDEVVLERVVNDTANGRVVIELVAQRVEYFPSSGRVEIDVALRNDSEIAVGLPALVFLGDFSPEGTAVINSDNQLIDLPPDVIPPAGPYPDWFDYAGTFGNDGILAAGEISDTRTWMVAVAGEGSFSFGAHVQVGTDPERATISGRVFFDENWNGQFDDNEIPFAAGWVELVGPDGTMQRTRVMDGGLWKLAIRSAGLYTARFISPPTLAANAPFVPWCETTPNPLEIVIVAGPDGEAVSFAQANFGLASYPCHPPSDGVVNLTSEPASSIETDHYRLLGAQILASPGPADVLPPTTWFLEVRVGFSGCSDDHPILAWAGQDFMESAPPRTWLRLEHDDRDELCDAYFEQTRLFDLSPLVDHFLEVYGGETPHFILELEGPNGESYQLSVP